MTIPHTVSVVIPTSGRRSLSAVHEGLARQSRPPEDICVVEDRDRRGPAWARNRGFERTKGDIVAFLDDDTVPPREWLADMLAALDATGADGAGGSFIESDPLLQEVRSLRPVPTHQVLDGFGLVGNSGNLVIRRTVLEAIRQRHGHVFAEHFGIYGSEDWELVMRVHNLGYKLVYVPSHVLHLRRVSFRSYLRHQYNRGIGVALLHKAIRVHGPMSLPQESLIWDPDRTHGSRFMAVLKMKVLGPFDHHVFLHKRFFLIHWLAEKSQGVGYLMGVLRYGR